MEPLQHDINNLQYDIPIELTAKQYAMVVQHCEGLVCNKVVDGKYYIKPWLQMKYVTHIINQASK